MCVCCGSTRINTKISHLIPLTTQSVEEGSAWSLCWSSAGETYATLDMLPEESQEEKKKKSKKNKDAQAAPVLRPVVRTCAVGATERRELPAPGPATHITGGHLLGVHTQIADAAAQPTQASPSAAAAPAQQPPVPLASPIASSPALMTASQLSSSPTTSPAPIAAPQVVAAAQASVTTSVAAQPTQALQWYEWSNLRAIGPSLPGPRLIVSFLFLFFFFFFSSLLFFDSTRRYRRKTSTSTR
jgi:hypothetical protein